MRPSGVHLPYACVYTLRPKSPAGLYRRLDIRRCRRVRSIEGAHLAADRERLATDRLGALDVSAVVRRPTIFR